MDSTSTARLEDTNSLTGFDEKQIKMSYPVFVPNKQKTRITIRLPSYGYKERLKTHANLEERRAYWARVEEYVTKEMSNLNGFAIFDETKRYQIILPAGWKKMGSPSTPAGSKSK